MKNPEAIKQHLELCRKLGVKYVSLSTVGETLPIPVSPIPTVEALTPPAQASAPPIFSAKGGPNWLTNSAETIQAMELIAFDKDICECQKCPLGKTRKNFVFGMGNPQAEVMFIGEAPGADEDEQGLPFVGKAGQLLTKIIESTNTWKRKDVFIANVLKCRPPGNRTPLPEEVEQCRPYLEEQIRVIKPKFIMALGASAAQALLKTKDSVGKLRNKWHYFEGVPLRVTYHPAALLRFDGYKKDVWEDMKEMKAKYLEKTKN